MQRPKIRPSYSWFERLLQILSLLTVVGLFVLTVCAMRDLPQTIPTHFGADGRADGWGGKSSLLAVPILTVVLCAGLAVWGNFPWILNFPTEITEKNARNLYRMGRLMLEWMEFVVAALFLYIQWQTVRVALGQSGGLGTWFLPIILVWLFGGMGFMIYKMSKCR